MYAARFEFTPESASDFLVEGQVVSEMAFLDIDEIVAYVQEFSPFLVSTLVCSQESGKIVDLSDFTIKE